MWKKKHYTVTQLLEFSDIRRDYQSMDDRSKLRIPRRLVYKTWVGPERLAVY